MEQINSSDLKLIRERFAQRELWNKKNKDSPFKKRLEIYWRWCRRCHKFFQTKNKFSKVCFNCSRKGKRRESFGK